MPRTKRVKSSMGKEPQESINRHLAALAPQPTPPTPNQRYAVLEKRLIVPSRYLDEETIQRLELDAEVTEFLDAIGWARFIKLRHNTFPSITLEFLSTLEVNINIYSLDAEGQIKFSLGGKRFNLSMTKINELLCLPNEGIVCVPQSTDWKQEAWLALSTGGQYLARHAKSSKLTNHSLRYLHRVMSNSIFGRGESTGVVSQPELLILWSMYSKTPINSGIWIMNHLMNVAKASSGKIVVGGLITTMAKALKIKNLGNPLVGPSRIDMSTLIAMGMVDSRTRDGRFHLEPVYPPSPPGSEEEHEDEGNEEQEGEQPGSSSDQSQLLPLLLSIQAQLARLETSHELSNVKLESILQVQSRHSEEFQALRAEMQAQKEEIKAMKEELWRENDEDEQMTDSQAGPSHHD